MKNYRRALIMTAVLLVGVAAWLGLRPRRVAAQSPSLTGSWGFMVNVPYNGPQSGPSFTLAGPAAIVGVMTFDGAGNVTGSQTFVQQDPSLTAINPKVQSQTFTGTYTVNADGTGTITTGGTTNTFVQTDGGAGALFVITAGGNFVATGVARRQ